MPADISYADVTHAGQVRFEKVPVVPAGSFGDPQIGAASPVDAAKLRHQYRPQLAQAHGAAAATERRAVHVAKSAGDVVAFEAGHVVAGSGGATLTFDLRKNGTSVLSGGTALSHPVTTAAYGRTGGTIATAPYAAGDVFEVVVTATAGGGTLPQGAFAVPTFREGA